MPVQHCPFCLDRRKPVRGHPTNRRSRRWLLRNASRMRLATFGFAAAKTAATFHYVPKDATVFDVSFGFGDHIRSLVEKGKLEWVLDDKPVYAARMPLLPLVYAGLARITQDLRTATIIRNFVLSGLVASSVRYLLDLQPDRGQASNVWSALCLLLSLSPPVVKHASSPHYEEGFLLEIVPIWCVAFLTTARSIWDGAAAPSHGVVVLTVLSGLSAFMLKSSMMLLLLLSEIAALASALLRGDRWSMLPVALSGAAVAAWGIRNQRVTGRFALRTSWDGENLYRGWSEGGYRLYPDVDLDRLFDSQVAYRADGESVVLAQQPSMRGFEDEWAWDSYYRREALSWMKDHPVSGTKYTLRKAWNFFASIKATPYTRTTDARRGSRLTRIESATTSSWLLIGRGLQLLMLRLMWERWQSRSAGDRALVSAVIAANAAYSLPYLTGFNYERHVTVYLALVASCVAMLASY